MDSTSPQPGGRPHEASSTPAPGSKPPPLPPQPAARLTPPATAPTPALPEPPAPPRPAVFEPPAKRNRLLNWVLLLLALALAAPPLVIDLARPQVVNPREARALGVSIQTYRHHQDASPVSVEWLVPSFNGKEQLTEAPALTWMQVAVFQLLPGPATLEHFVLTARIGAVALALLLIASAYWAGLSIGGLRAGLLAALGAASLPLVTVEGRQATGEIATAALVMFSVASALWAARPLRPSPGVARQVIGWTTCGLALGAAALTLGPGAIPVTLLPILGIILLTPRLLGHLLGLAAALCIAALAIVPWAVFVHESDPQTWRWWGWAWINTTYWLDGEAGPLGATLTRRLVMMALATLPWTLWLPAALMQPFSASSLGARRKLFVAWTWWLILVGLFLAAPAVGQWVYLLVLMPVTGVLLALVFDQFAELCDAGRYPRLWRFFRWPHMLVLVVGSVLAGLLLLSQDRLVSRGWLAEPVLADLGWGHPFGYGAGAMVVLLALSVLAIGTAIHQRPQRTFVYTALWTIALLGILAVPLSRGSLAASPQRLEGRKIAAATGDALTYWLHPEVGQVEFDPILMLYADRTLLPITPTQLTEALRQTPVVYVLAASTDDAPAAGAKVVLNLPHSHMQLWRVGGNGKDR